MIWHRQGFKDWASCGFRLPPIGYDLTTAHRCYGEDVSQEGVGYNLGFSVSWMNSKKDSDAALELSKATIKTLDHKFLNTDIVFFQKHPPTLEWVAYYVWTQIQKELPELEGLEVEVHQEGVAESLYVGNLQRVRYSRYYSVSCLHRHHNPDLSMQENIKLYSKCAGIHGHEYILRVDLWGPIDPQVGVVVFRQDMDEILQREFVDAFNGQILNEKLGNTSGELILTQMTERLKTCFSENLQLTLKLQETKKNSFYTYGSQINALRLPET